MIGSHGALASSPSREASWSRKTSTDNLCSAALISRGGAPAAIDRSSRCSQDHFGTTSRYVSERAATQEVAAERFVMVVIEIRNIDAGCDVTSEPIAAVEIEDAVARIRTDIRPPSQRNPSTQRYRTKLLIRSRWYAIPTLK